MEYLGLLIEVLFFALGAYLYLFARGFFKSKNPAMQQKADTFRKENAGWMRILGLALAAIMLVNIVLHIRDML